MTKHKWYKELEALANGKELQCKWAYCDFFVDAWVEIKTCNPITHPHYEWRIKPELNLVDMTALYTLEYLCKFSDFNNDLTCTAIMCDTDDKKLYFDGNTHWDKAVPVDKWHPIVNIIFDLKDIVEILAGAGFKAKIYDNERCFKIIGLCEGYAYPWEIEK